MPAEKITPPDLQVLLRPHLEGTALQPFVEQSDYQKEADGFVKVEVIDAIRFSCAQLLLLGKLIKNPHRLPGEEGRNAKMQQAADVLKPYSSDAGVDEEKKD